MPQDRASGARARRWGLENARKIADAVGAVMISKDSNECCYQGQSAVIKSAKVNTTRVGLTDSMVQRVKFVIAGFETKHGEFQLRKLSIQDFKEGMRVTAEGKPNMVARSFLSIMVAI